MRSVSVALLAAIIGCSGVKPISAADAVTFKEKVLYSLLGGTDGANPATAVIYVSGILYGTTTRGGGEGCGGEGCGTVFSVDSNSGAEKVLYSFCSQANCTDGALPEAGLIDVNGMLYGTTGAGGSGISDLCGNFGCGTVFSLDPNTGTETVLYSFCSQANCTDGQEPWGGLIDVKGRLYGATLFGGSNCIDSNLCGTVFALDLKTCAETVVYSFCSQVNCTDGANPFAGLINVKGTLYGTTSNGGTGGSGTVFSLDLTTGAEKTLYVFCSQQDCTDGAVPIAGLVDINGTLYGTTPYGGANCQSGDGCGTVFSLDLSTAGETVLYSFCGRQDCTDGANPGARLIAVNRKLYGTTSNGGGAGCGGSGCGTVFVLKKKH